MAAYSTLELCTIDELKERVSDLDMPLSLPDNTELEEAVLAKIGKAKKLIGDELDIALKDRFPISISALVRVSEAAIDNIKGRINRQQVQSGSLSIDSINSTLAVYSPDLSLGFTDFVTAFGEPRVYYYSGTPTNGTSGTFAGQAENGAFLIDSSNAVTYVNRNTKESPTWTRLQYKNLKDYILNKEVLLEWAIAKTLYLCFEDGMFRSRMRVSRDVEDKEHMDGAKYWDTKCREYKSQALETLEIDLSGDGTISDMEQQGSDSSEWFF